MTVSVSRTPARVVAPGKTRAQAWTGDWRIATFALLCWVFAPCLRRILDWRSGGFHAIDILSVLPMLAILPLIPYALQSRALARVPKIFKTFAIVWNVTLLYGLTVAALGGNGAAGLYEFAQYDIPLVFGLWLAGQSVESSVAANRIIVTLLVMVGIAGAYGVAQWIYPQPWDVLWIQGSGTISMGDPVPFSLRIFSTLNSAGPAADIFAICIILALPLLRLRSITPVVVVPILAAALMLTLVREAWLGLVLGFLTYLFASPKRLRVVPYLISGIVLVVVVAGSLPTLLGASQLVSDTITARFNTLGDVDHDDSAVARKSEYESALDEASRTPQGTGLGSFGASARLSSSVDVGQLGTVIDGGYIARLVSLGWVGVALYVFVVAGSPLIFLFALFKRAKRLPPELGAIAAAAISVGVYLMWDDVAGDSHYGLIGLMFWIATAIAARVIYEPDRDAARA